MGILLQTKENPAALQHTGFSFTFPKIQSNIISAVYLQIICALYCSQQIPMPEKVQPEALLQ